MEITYGGIISTNRWKIEDFHSVKQRWRCIIRGKGKRYLEEERIWFGKLIESTRRKRGWSVHNRSWIYLTTRDKSSRGVVPLLWSLKALGVLGIARLFLHLFGQIYGRAFIMKIDISREGAGGGHRLTVSRASCPPTETNKINFRVHRASAMSARRAEGCTWPPFRRVDTLL